MRNLALLGLRKHRFGAAAAWRAVVKHGPTFMTWFAVVVAVAGAAMCAVATLLL
jgi:hypothetical protein